ncbi:MAG: amylo-alpha-1,6-glucosidase [Nevskia sp.]|nr:amylo-alpha-1,6-glucosidase [Nevskia sp.]
MQTSQECSAAPDAHAGAGSPAPYSIPATAGLQERRPRTLKHGDSFAVFDHNGDALADYGSPEGVYHRDTRHLSHFGLTVDGVRPLLLSSTLRDDNATLTCDLSNPDLYEAGGALRLAHDLIHLRRTCFLWQARCYQRVVLRNFDERPQRVRVEFTFAADFADVFEVRGARRPRRGVLHAPHVLRDRVRLAYTGLDDVRRETLLQFHPVPARLTADRAGFDLELAPQAACALYVLIDCAGETEAAPLPGAWFTALRRARRALRRSSARAAAIVTSNQIFNESVRRSVSDLYMLMTDTPQGPFPYAGIPWFSTAFGRDAIITALEMLWLDPTVARGVLLHLAANQATATDPATDAQPGKILHEVRHGEMAQLGEVPFRRYYGSVDATPLFAMLAGAYLERTGDRDTLRAIKPQLEAALTWIERYGDCDGDGFVEYQRATGSGLVNQGWKDSHDSVFHRDGRLARGPIALVEVQAYTYGAWRAAAAVSRALGEPQRAEILEQRAARLRQRFDEAFFDPALGSYVLALDGDKRPCQVSTSNAGHALYTGIAYPERAGRVVAKLMDSASFSGWGVRTLAASEKRYNPMSYHNGSVWPHDNALIAAGFARYGYKREAARVFESLFAAASYLDLRRLPELFCGFARQRTRGPTFYPVACLPQAWAAAAPLSLLQSCLGLRFEPDAAQIVFDEPWLPSFLDEVVLRRLTVGSHSADVRLRRADGRVVVQVLARQGAVHILTRS